MVPDNPPQIKTVGKPPRVSRDGIFEEFAVLSAIKANQIVKKILKIERLSFCWLRERICQSE